MSLALYALLELIVVLMLLAACTAVILRRPGLSAAIFSVCVLVSQFTLLCVVFMGVPK